MDYHAPPTQESIRYLIKTILEQKNNLPFCVFLDIIIAKIIIGCSFRGAQMQDFSVSQQATQLTDSQISILKQLVFTPPSELDAKLAQFAEKESLSSRFIIKMEIARLFKPCSRVIDLRDTYPDCKLFDMHGVKHYLNNQAKSILVNNIKMFKGYTNGVYESVTNTMKKIKQTNQKTHASAFLPDANFFSVTGFHKRRNQRLFCVSKLKVFLQDPSRRNKSRELPVSEDAISSYSND